MSDLLEMLVRIPSPSMHERAAVSVLVDWLNAHGFAAHIDAAGNAVGLRGDAHAPHTLMLLGHIDTFPGDLPVFVRDGCLYGRGSVDAKGSLCAFAEAAAGAAIPAGWRVIVVGAVEEEIATSKGARQIAADYMPTLCVIGEPSGADKITLGYKGRILVDLTLTRPPAHTARPEPSVGALGVAFWNVVEAWAARENGGVEGYFGRVMPYLRAINTASDGLSDTLNMTISVRLPPRIAPDVAWAAIRACAPPDATLHPYGMERAYQGERTTPLVRAFLAAIRARGATPGFVLKTGTSDMNVVGAAWACPIVAYGAGDSDLDHTPEEHIALDEYARAVQTLRHVIEYL
jgi:LysW-gamma-L-lysine carboxypeptidase